MAQDSILRDVVAWAAMVPTTALTFIGLILTGIALSTWQWAPITLALAFTGANALATHLLYTYATQEPQ